MNDKVIDKPSAAEVSTASQDLEINPDVNLGEMNFTARPNTPGQDNTLQFVRGERQIDQGTNDLAIGVQVAGIRADAAFMRGELLEAERPNQQIQEAGVGIMLNDPSFRYTGVSNEMLQQVFETSYNLANNDPDVSVADSPSATLHASGRRDGEGNEDVLAAMGNFHIASAA